MKKPRDVFFTTSERLLALTRASGAIVSVLGLVVVVGWAFEIGALKTVLPGLASMKANTAVCFILSGIALVSCSTRRAWRAGRLAAVAVQSVALATLAEYFLEVDLGIDELVFRDPDTPASLHPGRMSKATSAGFVAASLLLLLGAYAARFPRLILAARALAVGIAAFGVLGILGYLLGLDFLISALRYQASALHTAFGFLVLGAGLFPFLQPREPLAEDRRIGGFAALVLVLAAGTTGLVSFATIGRQVQGTLAQGVTAALDARTREITTNVVLRTARAQIITSRRNMLKHLRLLVSDPAHPEYRAVVAGVVESFLPYGFSGIAITLPSGWEVARAGAFIGLGGARCGTRGDVAPVAGGHVSPPPLATPGHRGPARHRPCRPVPTEPDRDAAHGGGPVGQHRTLALCPARAGVSLLPIAPPPQPLHRRPGPGGCPGSTGVPRLRRASRIR